MQTMPAPADALVSNVPGLRLLIQTADCQAVMLFDPQKRVAANIHCGWRGSVADIIGQTISRMVSEFGCDPGQMHAGIGPSLGPCCAEFVNFKNEIPRQLWPFRVGAHHFDFWRISRHQLSTAGLVDGNIYDPGICTRCNPHLFFSYRAARTTGRFAAVIGMDG
jgi:YfiH family protein